MFSLFLSFSLRLSLWSCLRSSVWRLDDSDEMALNSKVADYVTFNPIASTFSPLVPSGFVMYHLL
jgi:hypothetical protein